MCSPNGLHAPTSSTAPPIALRASDCARFDSAQPPSLASDRDRPRKAGGRRTHGASHWPKRAQVERGTTATGTPARRLSTTPCCRAEWSRSTVGGFSLANDPFDLISSAELAPTKPSRQVTTPRQAILRTLV